MFCTKCGKELPEGAKFCLNCGERADSNIDFSEVRNYTEKKVVEVTQTIQRKSKENINITNIKSDTVDLTKKDSIIYLVFGGLFLFYDVLWVLIHLDVEFGYFLFPAIISLSFYVYFLKFSKLNGTLFLVSGILFGGLAVIYVIFSALINPYGEFAYTYNFFVKIFLFIVCFLLSILFVVIGVKNLENVTRLEYQEVEVKPLKSENHMTNSENETTLPIRNYNPAFDYTPISMWGYFFYTILFNLPVIGWICTIVFAVGATRNVNLRNFARSYFCLDIIIIALALLITLFLGIVGASF